LPSSPAEQGWRSSFIGPQGASRFAGPGRVVEARVKFQEAVKVNAEFGPDEGRNPSKCIDDLSAVVTKQIDQGGPGGGEFAPRPTGKVKSALMQARPWPSPSASTPRSWT